MRPTIHAARLRLLRLPARSTVAMDAARLEAAELEATAVEDVAIVIGRGELDRLAAALSGLLGPELHRPDTPARLESALAGAVERLGGSGRPRVVRSPAGLTTPEAWQVRLDSIEPDVAEAIRAATRTGRFPTATR